MRVVLADDSVLFREGLARLLVEVGHEVVAQVGDAEALLAVVRTAQPEVAVVDIKMPPTHTSEGLDAARRLRQNYPRIGILVLSQYVETQHVVDLLEEPSGGIGYLLKDRVTDAAQLADAVTRVAAGDSVIEPHIVRQLVSRKRITDPLERLTDRERSVLSLMAEGRSNQAIGERLFLTHRTVESHVRNILTKLGLEEAPDNHRRVLAVLTYLRSASD